MNSKVVGGRGILENRERERERKRNEIKSQIFRDPFGVSRIWFSPHTTSRIQIRLHIHSHHQFFSLISFILSIFNFCLSTRFQHHSLHSLSSHISCTFLSSYICIVINFVPFFFFFFIEIKHCILRFITISLNQLTPLTTLSRIYL